jgi:glycosyltransferase involved in cell wall biosynthesis
MTKKRVLLLSAYDAQSHRYWHQQLVAQFSQHQWQVLTLKNRYFAWRMGGNALNFKALYDAKLKAGYDVLIATSMTDLSTLLGLYPHLAALPKHLYFHENQFAYPVNKQQQGLIEIQLRSIYSALAADYLWFNSKYNRDTFIAGVEQLTQQMPDGIPTDLLDTLSDKSTVLAVPIAADCLPVKHTNTTSATIEVVWNHRWEHDKGPETLLEVMRLCTNNKRIKFHIMGQQFRTMPAALQEVVENHQHQCLTLGYIESRTQYIQTLQQADVVLSTALHDFQGIAMLEAAACGCKPVAPNSLVYPELYPLTNLYPSTPKQPDKEAQAIWQLLTEPQHLQAVQPAIHWQHLQPHYAQLLH